ncbi:hypothetical protein DTO006G1_446 [Penicillium roqueforti]|nr:hypothetical protein CBS147337_4614 [Penicillium roqueforti]KAI2692378.1 hypothetical protein LCP963914a_472 [Penicillium roqueforti]KAI2765146.1 hypothetical protein DTO006G1_446 [Penicillium roqueforti]KAI3076904.1 hypothetical protein CBS147339_4874 [Penicillium roqueforti]KAI3103453.1 hypothetical protein CBS147338_1982 [Penicillium roqueforti]
MDTGDRMLCHACGGVWTKDGDFLTCPHCQSEFTEIIEIPPEISPEGSPSRRADSVSPSRVSPWLDHNPWEHDTQEQQGPGFFGRATPPFSSLRTYRSPDGRFSFSSATLETGRPSGQRNNGPNPVVPMMMHGFDTIFQNLMEPNARGYRGFGEDPFHPQSSTAPDWLEDDHLTGHHPGLSPRNADAPQPVNRNPTDINEIMDAIRADIGVQTTRRSRGGRNPASPHALSILSALLNMSRSGDAVYSQEELDRVITQLVDNPGGTSTAAPPASDAAVQALPKKKITEEMMGSEGKAVCSICMDNVELGLEVTVLPCAHWFHYNCIHAWLTQHDTCPHCRRSINSNTTGGEGTPENPVVIRDSPEQPRSQPRRSSARTVRSGRSSLSSSLQSRLSTRMSPPGSPTPEGGESRNRRSSRGEGVGGLAGWLTNRFGSSA